MYPNSGGQTRTFGRMQLRTSGLSSRRVGDDIVILDLEQSKYLSLTGSGAVLFDALQEECDVDSLIATLLERFVVDEPTARKDVENFVEQLKQANLLVDVSA